MKVFLLNPPYGMDFVRSARWAARSRGRVQRHPDWMLIGAAVLERGGHQIKFLDGAALNLSPEAVDEERKRFHPDLVVVHTTTPSIASDLDFAKRAKEGGMKVVVIGPHVTAVPEDTLRRAPFLDAVVLGEYDETLLEIADGRPLGSVAGLALPSGDSIRRTGPRAPFDVRNQPFPAWHHIRPEWYRDAGKRFPFLTLISGRGCPNACTFCRDTPIMFGRRTRLRDPLQVVDEIQSDLAQFPGLKEIMFETDTFTADPRHVSGICEEMLRRGLTISWSCNARVDIDPHLLPLMKRAGCRMLMVGFEFGTQQSLDRVRKGVLVEQSRSFAERASRLGFTIHGCFMIGAPGETRKSAKETIDFACGLPLDTIQISGMCPYPGTELYEWAKANGYLLPKDWSEWVGKDLEQVTLLDYPNLRKAEMDRLIDRGLKKFYLRPRQILRMIMQIRSWDDLRRKVFGFASFLDYFTK